MPPVQKRYLDALHYCRVACGFDNFTMTGAIRQFKIASMFPTAVKELGLIERKSGGRHAKWHWVGGIPTEEHAAQIAALIESYNAALRERLGGKKPHEIPSAPTLAPEDMRSAIIRLEQKLDTLISLWS